MLTLSPAASAAPAAAWFVGRLPLVDDHRRTATRPRSLLLPTAAPAPTPAVRVEHVQDALRDFNRPSRLAGSPLAPAHLAPAERAAAVRTLLTDAVAQAFGEDDDEQLLRTVVQRSYFEGRAHESVHWELHVSRATYFRRRRIAVARITEWLGAHGAV